jgi:hypothetical protein
MGLLDEAIRDHLELKRQRGADPTEVAREEREALEPVFPDEPRPQDLLEDDGEAGFVDGAYPEQASPEVAGLPIEHGGAPPEPSPPDFSTLGQETAELDMQSVLDADGPLPGQDLQAPEQIPGQERLTFE